MKVKLSPKNYDSDFWYGDIGRIEIELEDGEVPLVIDQIKSNGRDYLNIGINNGRITRISNKPT